MKTPLYKVFAIRYGTGFRKQQDVFYRYPLYGEPDSEVVLEYFSWVAIGTDEVVVIDTGASQSVAEARGVEYIGTPLSGLEMLGVNATDVRKVILTHLHYDHIGNTSDYPSAQFYVSEAEVAFWTGPNLSRLQFKSVVEEEDLVALLRLTYAGRVSYPHDGEEIAPGIKVLCLPGHTPGQLAVEIMTEQGTIFLASNAVHYYDEVAKMRPFNIFNDLPAMYDSYERIYRMVEGNLNRIVPGHDPQVIEKFGWASDAFKGRIIRIA